ncbi:MAG: SPOR domain-containing protein [Sedimenticola sp.]
MDEDLKKRLIGATVLVSLAVIFVPMLLDDEPVIDTGIQSTNIPPKPDETFSSRILPLESEDLSQPPADLVPVEREREAVVPIDEPSTGTAPAESTETPVQKPRQRVGLSAWVLQVGSFSNRENADKLVKELKQKQFAAFVEQVEIKGKKLHRVRVGPEVDRARAEQMLTRLNKVLKTKKIKASLKSYP